MSDFENLQLNNQHSPMNAVQTFNTYWQYSFMDNSAFYQMIPDSYYDFANRWVRNWLWWYDGWVPHFHNQNNGIQATRIATALCDKTAKKVIGGRIMYKNAGQEHSGSNVELNKALSFISTKWAKESDFSSCIKRAVKYACAGGTALIKLNKNNKGLWCEPLRFDSFMVSCDFSGEINEVFSFLQQYTDMTKKEDVYYLVEHRYFGEYQLSDGTVLKKAPLIEYVACRNKGNNTNARYLSMKSEKIEVKSLPRKIRESIIKDYGVLECDTPFILPFSDYLGVELVKWTECISNLPNLPFGESLLSTILPYLASWDYHHSALDTDMYLGRGRVLASSNSLDNVNGNYNSGLDSFVITKLPYSSEDNAPIPLQFNLRATEWTAIRDLLVQDIAINTGLNISTIASFLTDNTARTAREVSTEENETAGFVDDKRELIEKPFNNIIKRVLRYYGYVDDVVIRWSSAGLTNRMTLTEIINMAMQGGFLSKYKAVQMFNYDDDDAQVQEEYERIIANEDTGGDELELQGM